MEYLQGNLEIIQKRWPRIADALNAAPAVEGAVVQDGPQQTLLIDGIHLSSSYDRQVEADLQASLVPLGSEEAWVYGVGLGDLPRALLSRPQIRRLNVVLLNPSVAFQSFRFFPHTDWLRDERVNLFSAACQSTIRFPFAAVPSCLQLSDNASSRLRDLVHLELSTPFIRKNHASGQLELQKRLEENLPLVANDGDVAELFGRYEGQTILVAGAGPTLSEHYERLRSRKSPLIAVDAALKPLIAAGVVPEFVVTIDPNAQVVPSFFREADLGGCANSSLVYFPTVHRDVMEIWPGLRFAAFSAAAIFQDIGHRIRKAELFSSGSVIHPAVDLAIKMGASQVVLLGADFAYPGNLSHVEGCVTVRSVPASGHWVLDGSGHRVPTRPNMRGYLRDLEIYIVRHPHILFISGSTKGARIEGTRFLESHHAF